MKTSNQETASKLESINQHATEIQADRDSAREKVDVLKKELSGNAQKTLLK